MLEDDDKILPGSPVKELELKLSPFREQIFTDLKCKTFLIYSFFKKLKTMTQKLQH